MSGSDDLWAYRLAALEGVVNRRWQVPLTSRVDAALHQEAVEDGGDGGGVLPGTGSVAVSDAGVADGFWGDAEEGIGGGAPLRGVVGDEEGGGLFGFDDFRSSENLDPWGGGMMSQE